MNPTDLPPQYPLEKIAEMQGKYPRESVFVGLPIMDRRVDYAYHTGLMKCLPFYGRSYSNMGISNISQSRNEVAHVFMEKSECDWLMWIDSDIEFTENDWCLLWEGSEEIVIAGYARKVLGQDPTQFGMGFTRVHRNVYQKIKDLLTADGQEHAQRFRAKGEEFINYHPTGANSIHRWLGEDDGFFMLAHQAGASLRLETRTKLVHWGNFGFQYPLQIPMETILMLVEKSGQMDALRNALNEIDGAN